jgi:hypothetical protein
MKEEKITNPLVFETIPVGEEVPFMESHRFSRWFADYEPLENWMRHFARLEVKVVAARTGKGWAIFKEDVVLEAGR